MRETNDVRPLIHQALIYDDDTEFLAATTGFCRDGLATGEKVLAVTTPANITLLTDALGPAAARVDFAPAEEWYRSPGRTLTAYGHYVDTHAATGVRIIGEPVWHGRDHAEQAEWTRYESVINAALADRPARIMCPYDQRTLPAHILTDAHRT
ncbi:hypothetical protein C1I98_38415, partial [Spongiactinospora gelatinilytica]